MDEYNQHIASQYMTRLVVEALEKLGGEQRQLTDFAVKNVVGSGIPSFQAFRMAGMERGATELLHPLKLTDEIVETGKHYEVIEAGFKDKYGDPVNAQQLIDDVITGMKQVKSERAASAAAGREM